MALLAHAFGCTMDQVRAMTYRDIDAMTRVLVEEQHEAERRQQIAERKRGRR